jgi:hypothetical protein
VFVTAGDGSAGTSELYALDATIGKFNRGPVDVRGPWSGLAYGGGRVFTVKRARDDGVL